MRPSMHVSSPPSRLQLLILRPRQLWAPWARSAEESALRSGEGRKEWRWERVSESCLAAVNMLTCDTKYWPSLYVSVPSVLPAGRPCTHCIVLVFSMCVWPVMSLTQWRCQGTTVPLRVSTLGRLPLTFAWENFFYMCSCGGILAIGRMRKTFWFWWGIRSIKPPFGLRMLETVSSTVLGPYP